MTAGEPLRFIHQHHPGDPADHQRVTAYKENGSDVAVIVWQICHTCRVGIINKISIMPDWQRQGLGRRLATRALRDGPDYVWSTSGQSPEGRQFFRALAAESGAAFKPSVPTCDHIHHAGRGARVADRHARLDRGV